MSCFSCTSLQCLAKQLDAGVLLIKNRPVGLHQASAETNYVMFWRWKLDIHVTSYMIQQSNSKLNKLGDKYGTLLRNQGRSS